jgi:multiple sugar transport system substrate-binding protein
MKLLKQYKKTRFAAALLSLVFFASGCSLFGGSTTSSTKVSLTMWGLFDTSDAIQPFITAYEQAHPNVTIVYSEKSVTTYENDLLNALAVPASAPDIIIIGNNWLPKYEDKLRPATAAEYTVKDYENNFADVAAGDFIANGEVYAAPLSTDTLALYYNKDILGSAGIAQPPQTWADLAADSQKISRMDSTGYFTRSGIALGTSTNVNRAQDIMYDLMLQTGTVPYTSDDSQSTIDQAGANGIGNASQYPGAQALSFYTSFANPSSPNYDWNAKSNYSTDAFANGQLAMMYGYYYDESTILQKSPNLNFGVAPVPQPTLGQNLVNYSNYWGYGVTQQSKNPNWAWDFIKSMTTKASLDGYYKLNPQPASRKDGIAEQVNDPVLSVFSSSTLTSKNFYKVDDQGVDAIILSMIDDVTLRNVSVTTALSTAAQKITALSNSQSN